MNFLTYLFWPNPENTSYDNPKVLALIAVCAAMILLGVILSQWRKRTSHSIARKLSRSWPSASVWFGVIGLVLVVSRVEHISFISMRVLWFVWAGVLLLYVIFQARVFRSRHYEILPRDRSVDPKDKYLPGKKKH